MNKLSPISILLDAHIFDHSFQGTATYIHGLYSELVKYEDLKISLCANNVENLKILFPDDRFNFIKLKAGGRFKRLFVEYPKIIKDGNFDYAHFQYVVPFIKRCKFINTIHDLLFLDFKQYFPWSYRASRYFMFYLSAIQSDILCTVSNYSREDLCARFKIKNEKIIVTPNAVTFPAKSFHNIEALYGIRKYILYVSRFEPRKNHIGLLRAFIKLELHKQGYHLVLIGSKKEEIEINAFNELKSIINPELSSYINFFDGIDWPTLNAFYQQANCFVFPSLAEGFGIPPIEAAVNGSKVLCSNRTAMSEFTFFKYHVDPTNQDDLTNNLKAILEDENYPFEQIRTTISSIYNWKTIAHNLHSTIIKNFYG